MEPKAFTSIIAKSFIEVFWESREKDIKDTQDDLNRAKKYVKKTNIMYYIVSLLIIILPIISIVIFFCLTTPTKILTTFLNTPFWIKFIRNVAKEIKRHYRRPRKIDVSEI